VANGLCFDFDVCSLLISKVADLSLVRMTYVAMKQESGSVGQVRVGHGGRVYEAARRWRIDPGQVIDFSANINPLGPPQAVLAASKDALLPVNLRAYPDADKFINTLANKHRLMPDEIVVGSGTAALMFAVLHALAPKRVLVLEPAFGEYLRACVAAKTEVETWRLKPENGFTPDFASLIRAVKERRFDLLILNSPHNPTGLLYSRDELLALVGAAEEQSVAIMLDEAFIDYQPHASLASLAATGLHLIVLRSLTKFYAIPALRLGYALCGAQTAHDVREQIDPWSVSTVALEAGCGALAKDEFGTESRRINERAREEFAVALHDIGLHVFPSAANFLLARLPFGAGGDLEHWLEAERILIRRCDSFAGLGDEYVRLAVRSSSDNLRLVSLIEGWLKRSKSRIG
jgi:threonine-phosphate decarboxylase